MSWVVIAGWLLGWGLLWRLPLLGRPAPTRTHPLPSTSVVIPARNEADRLPDLLASLGGQTHPASEVVVVDDGSTDGTAAVADAVEGVQVVTSGPVPEGWTGKSWACQRGVASTSGEVLVLLDADVVLADDALEALLDAWQEEGGLLSVQPRHHIRRRVEALSLPFNVVIMMGTGIGSLVRPAREWAATGPCMVASRRDHQRIGGHGSVQGAVAEDLALAARFGEAGLAVRCLGGGDRVGFRMYRDLRGLAEGWTKNLATGAGRTPLLRSLAVAGWVTALLTLAVTAVTTAPSLGAGVAYAAGAVQVGVMGRQVGRFRGAWTVWPVLVLWFVGIFAWSLVRTLVWRRVRWSGRDVALAVRR